MRRFTRLHLALDRSTRATDKLAALRRYFSEAAPEDASWAVFLLTGGKLGRIVAAGDLREFAGRATGLPDWILDASYDAVGDMAETIALLLPNPAEPTSGSLSYWTSDRLLQLKPLPAEEKYLAVAAAWRELSQEERLVWNKLLTGTFRAAVPRQLVMRALAEVAGVTTDVIAHRLIGDWNPTPDHFSSLLRSDTDDAEVSRHYPFQFANPLESAVQTLGERANWHIERDWGGIRAQLVRREGQTFLWTSEDELVTELFPEISTAADSLPDGVAMDGEIVAWTDGAMLEPAELRKRLGRKTASARLKREVPAVLFAFDLLEEDGADIRTFPLSQRLARLSHLLSRLSATERARLQLAPLVESTNWNGVSSERDRSRLRRADGLVLKRLDSTYRADSPLGDWWMWKVDPLTVTAVLLYAHREPGRGAGPHADFTFGLWRGGELVPFAKTHSGLTDSELFEIDQFVRSNTLEQFGPVRAVAPGLVFELSFEGIHRSARHKSGVAVRSPRIVRWCRGTRPEDADSLETIGTLLGSVENVDAHEP